eukprot:scaffold1393_cov343-Prasinococcus_capsulatus_cf.AAC.6
MVGWATARGDADPADAPPAQHAAGDGRPRGAAAEGQQHRAPAGSCQQQQHVSSTLRPVGAAVAAASGGAGGGEPAWRAPPRCAAARRKPRANLYPVQCELATNKRRRPGRHSHATPAHGI